MSGATITRSERRILRPTSDNIVYDIRDISVGDEPTYVHENFRTPLANTSRRLLQMLAWQENWNGYGAAKPDAAIVVKALRWIDHVRMGITKRRMRWREPHVVADTNGHVVFEWSCGDRTLSVYVSPSTSEFLKVSGPDIYSDMEDGEVVVFEDFFGLWHWLMEQE